jgi:hypothetical protein
MQGVGTRAIVEGIQRCFCMDIQIFVMDSIRVSITQNLIGHYYTIGTLSHI